MPRIVVLASILLLMAGLFSGCAAGPSDPTTDRAPRRTSAAAAAGADASALERTLGAQFQPGQPQFIEDWFVLPTTARPDAPLVAASWELPPRSIIGLRYQGDAGAVLEIAPISRTGAVVEWCLALFKQRDGLAFPVGYREAVDGSYYTGIPLSIGSLQCEVPTQRTTGYALTRSTRVQDPSSAPRFMVLHDQDLAALENIWFVLGARAAEAVPFGLAIRVLDAFPGGQRPAPDLDEFRARRGSHAPFLLETRPAGSGFQYSLFSGTFEVRGNLTSPTVGLIDVRTAGLRLVNPAPDARPAASAWLLDLPVDAAVREGWSLAQFDYKTICGVGDWSLAAMLHGRSFARNGIRACDFFGSPFVGGPQALFAAAGAGPARVTLRLNGATTGTEGILFQHLAFTMNVEAALGVEAGVVDRANSRPLPLVGTYAAPG